MFSASCLFRLKKEKKKSFKNPIHRYSLWEILVWQQRKYIDTCCSGLFALYFSIMMISSIGMKELSPPAVSLKKLYQETMASEPILIIISPGADPSQELLELATETVGQERFHQVSS